MNILVTGANGFTGQHFVRLAQQAGLRTVALVADLTDAAAVRQAVQTLDFDAVVHLAAISFVGHGDARAFYDVNLFGTLNLLQALRDRAAPLRQVLVASSANIYGNQGSGQPLAEETPPAPVNHYAMSKLAMEHMARTFSDSLPLVMARPFNYTGPGQGEQFVIPKLVAHARARAAQVRLGNVHVQREYNDVRWVCQAYLRLLQTGAAGHTYNVCTGQTYDFAAVVAALEQLSGHRLALSVDAALVRPNEVHRLCGDPTRLLAATGPLPAFTLAQTLAWMLETPAHPAQAAP